MCWKCCLMCFQCKCFMRATATAYITGWRYRGGWPQLRPKGCQSRSYHRVLFGIYSIQNASTPPQYWCLCVVNIKTQMPRSALSSPSKTRCREDQLVDRRVPAEYLHIWQIRQSCGLCGLLENFNRHELRTRTSKSPPVARVRVDVHQKQFTQYLEKIGEDLDSVLQWFSDIMPMNSVI